MMPGASFHRLARWLWQDRAPAARLVRLVLLPVAVLFRGVTLLRAALYRHGAFAVRRLPLPAVAVGNLTVGGSGKTPLAVWIARCYVARGRKPGILLRGYGRDEALVHQRLVAEAVVVPDPDRVAGARRAVAVGAEVLVLDDAYQHLQVARDLNVVAVSAESLQAVPWPLPAGPWREGWGALGRADQIVVTRKQATAEAARHLAEALARRRPGIPVSVAHLNLNHLEGMQTGARHSTGLLRGKRVVAAAGIADPEGYAVQVRATGAIVQLVAYQDHHPYGDDDIARLVRAAGEADYVVVTEKDAVKLRERWPADAPEPLVAALDVEWELNGGALARALDALLAVPGRP